MLDVRTTQKPSVDTIEVWGQRIVREKMKVAARDRSHRALHDLQVLTI